MRIAEERWDDVVLREPPPPPKGREDQEDVPELSQEKSKLGLGEVYEKQYMKQTLQIEEADPRAKDKEEMTKLFRKLSYKLDSLTHFHFTPKPVMPESEVRVQVPALVMEEVLPLGVSAEQAQAPEATAKHQRGARDGKLVSKEELDQDDRQRIRAGKKAARRKDRRRRESNKKLAIQANPGLGNPYAKDKLLESLKASNVIDSTKDQKSGKAGKEYTSSTQFFAKLQQDVASQVGSVGNSQNKRKREDQAAKSSSFKL
uniref:Uncharacterized protein n=1 Tax=Fibrocapsa japonica TaxID=94617 RepID=A0A7S2UUX2_9STRA